ncbi:hypothetical protein Lfu02_36900 [Longispora fulva]|uniref:Uncharacterized protein n=1 Tax=Longispora fulva TaxID=619741 RepID=A0A8J7KPP3_9ACTN|nr:hypothetical protein [Longispora fulva]MBG6141531.1 hypothetical protein [Longispora fulva]GIG59318.1 hypothetical protein Lfu02_36900 [Longispora fulva]
MTARRQRPATAADTGARLKLHRRRMWLDGREYTVLGLRPGGPARFATNLHHECWHVLSDLHGARLLGRLLWGLAFQPRPNTLVLIDRPFLDPNPFDAEPSDPIALMASTLTPLSPQAARRLRRQLPLTRSSDGTVGWRTHGLDTAMAEVRAQAGWWEHRRHEERPWRAPAPETGRRCDRIGGLIVFAGPPALLRQWAVDVYRLGDWWHAGQCATEDLWPGGEVQILRDYHRQVALTGQVRAGLLSEAPRPPRLDENAPTGSRQPGPAHGELSPRHLRRLIWQRRLRIQSRRRPAG